MFNLLSTKLSGFLLCNWRISAFMWVVRTNNDAEGWHNSLNQKIRFANPNFYKLVEDLYYESRLLPLHVTLVCQGTFQRRQRTPYSKMKDKVCSYCDWYNRKTFGHQYCWKNALKFMGVFLCFNICSVVVDIAFIFIFIFSYVFLYVLTILFLRVKCFFLNSFKFSFSYIFAFFFVFILIQVFFNQETLQ
jgi:hypothetical protein